MARRKSDSRLDPAEFTNRDWSVLLNCAKSSERGMIS